MPALYRWTVRLASYSRDNARVALPPVYLLSYRDVEELLAERGIETSYETVRRWVLKFGPKFARNLRRLRPKPSGT